MQELIQQAMSQQMHVVVAVLYVLGTFLKRIPKIPDWGIPFILAVVGAALGFLTVGEPAGLMQGILAAGAAVTCNQMVKQVGKAKQDKNSQ